MNINSSAIICDFSPLTADRTSEGDAGEDAAARSMSVVSAWFFAPLHG